MDLQPKYDMYTKRFVRLVNSIASFLMMSSPPLPKIYVITHRATAQEMILRELCLKPVELVLRTDERQCLDPFVFPESVSERLTTEEYSVLRLIIGGLTAKEAGASLDVSVRTFHYRKHSILHKLGVKTRRELIEFVSRAMSQTAA